MPRVLSMDECEERLIALADVAKWAKPFEKREADNPPKPVSVFTIYSKGAGGFIQVPRALPVGCSIEKSKKEGIMGNFPKFYGKVPVGTKGQIVIPAEARKIMNINPGDNVIIISGPPHHNRIVSIIPEDEFAKFLKFFEEQVSNLKKVVSE